MCIEYYILNLFFEFRGALKRGSLYRELCVLKTINFSDVIHVDVGALTVGRIIQHFPQGGEIKKGDEKVFFEFGASTIILLFKPDVVIFDKDIVDHSKQNIETIVKIGEKIGKKKKFKKHEE